MIYRCNNKQCKKESKSVNYLPELKMWLCYNCLCKYFKGRLIIKTNEIYGKTSKTN